MKVIARFMVLALIFGAAPALSVETGLRPTPAEMPRLPDFCQARFNLQRGSAEWNSWGSRLGESFNDIHHYCGGLNYLNRYWGARSKRDKNFYLERALAGMDYLVKSHKPDFPLRAQMYSNRGEVYKLMGRSGEAVKDLNEAIASDPRMVRPYLQLADIHVKGKAASRALETVTEGLRHVPDSTALQRRYLELGGKKPFPDPLVAKVPEPPAQQDAPASSEEAATPATAAVATESAPGEAAPAIGTPKNPYCRFCPPE